jgi:capsular polysaccharide transport system ATP-binding protein
MVSHDLKQIREFCSAGIVLTTGKLTYFGNVEEAIEEYMNPV